MQWPCLFACETEVRRGCGVVGSGAGRVLVEGLAVGCVQVDEVNVFVRARDVCKMKAA